ncbi:MAG: DUF359 domain-containing protein [Desulfurococcales archaeon]|nr:DUF359 domain-containing protein [Desulfurococcales archaeon]
MSNDKIPVFQLPFEHRSDFARPRGLLVTGDFTKYLDLKAPSIVCVGDVVSSYCIRIAKKYNGKLILLVDGKTRRTQQLGILEARGIKRVKVENPQSTIAVNVYDLLCGLLSSHQDERVIIEVQGEEDMLALPAIACSPIGGIVVYGVPGKGATIIRVNKWTSYEARSRFLSLVPKLVS